MSSQIVSWIQKPNHHNDYQLIGKGGFGRVFKVFNTLDNQYYAIKQIKVDENNIENALKEVRILASVSHKNIIRYYHSWITSTPYLSEDCPLSDDEEEYDDDTSLQENQMVLKSKPQYFFNIQMEYCESTLRKYLCERILIDMPICFDIVRQITLGLLFLHHNTIVHRDLKPDNVLISSFAPFHVKITDFGLAKKNMTNDNTPTDASSYAGSFLYAAPEQLQYKTYSYASDIYSLGIMIYELQHIFPTHMERIISIKNLKTHRLAAECLYFKDLILSMTDPIPEKRPTLSLLQNEYFTDWDNPVIFCRDIVWGIISSVLAVL